MDYFYMYLFTRLDVLNTSCSVVTSVGSVVLCIWAFVNLVEEEWEKYKKSFIIALGIWLAVALFYLLVPTQKEAAAIYLVPKIINNEKVIDITDNSLSLVELKLEEWITNLAEENKNE